jgi:hypothetical protein
MSYSVAPFFQTKTVVKDGLTQPQREAIADLLHFCMYADNHIALAETQVINDVVGTFAWDKNISFESFEVRSIAAARAAKETPDARQMFLDSIKERLPTSRSRGLALDACKKLFVADGMNEKDAALLSRISSLLT